METIFGFLYMGCTLVPVPPGEYDRAVHVRRRCGLMSNYFDHLLLLLSPLNRLEKRIRDMRVRSSSHTKTQLPVLPEKLQTVPGNPEITDIYANKETAFHHSKYSVTK